MTSCIILEMSLMGTNFSIYNISVTHPGQCCSVLKILAVLLSPCCLSFVVEPKICDVLDINSKYVHCTGLDLSFNLVS